MTNYIYCTVILKEEFELFTGRELNPFPQRFLANKSHYSITAVTPQRVHTGEEIWKKINLIWERAMAIMIHTNLNKEKKLNYGQKQLITVVSWNIKIEEKPCFQYYGTLI